jgi:hypothetical protein
MAQKDKKAPEKEIDSSSSEIARRFKQNPAVFIGTVAVLVLVIVSFVLVPAFVPDSARGSGDLTFGYYDKIPITWVPGNMFAQYYEEAIRYYQSQGIDIGNFRIAAEIWRQAFDRAVVHTALMQMLKRSNYLAPERTVDRNVAQLPQFQENGRFSSALYKQMSDSSRLTLWQQIRDELGKIMFFNDFFGLLIPSGEADFIASMSIPARTFDMVFFNVDDYPDSEYLSYALENSSLFDTVHLSKITVTNEREARGIRSSIINGTITFEEAARTQSQDDYADRGGDMGSRYCYELEMEIPNTADREIIYRLAAGELSNIINIGGGWAFFRVEEDLTRSNFQDEEVMGKVRSYVRNIQRGRMEDWAIEQANGFIVEVKESGFDNAVRRRNITKHSFGPLPINYGGIDLFNSIESFSIANLTPQDLQGLSRNENFWKVAFSAPLNSPSEPLVQGSYVFIFIPTGQSENEESSLEALASMYSSYWLNSINEQSLQYYFLSNARMDDRFWDTYLRYFRP